MVGNTILLCLVKFGLLHRRKPGPVRASDFHSRFHLYRKPCFGVHSSHLLMVSFEKLFLAHHIFKEWTCLNYPIAVYGQVNWNLSLALIGRPVRVRSIRIGWCVVYTMRGWTGGGRPLPPPAPLPPLPPPRLPPFWSGARFARAKFSSPLPPPAPSSPSSLPSPPSFRPLFSLLPPPLLPLPLTLSAPSTIIVAYEVNVDGPNEATGDENGSGNRTRACDEQRSMACDDWSTGASGMGSRFNINLLK